MGKFLDAALNGAASFAGKAYFFKGAKYVRYDWAKEQGDPDYPLGLDQWGFPAPFDKGIDAAVEGREEYEKAYFFKDDKYIRYDWTGKGKVDQAPKSILDGWKLPAQFFAAAKKIDAAINGVGEYARYCYLFSGTSWVRIDWKEEEEPVLHKGTAPADWGLPPEMAKGVDAALSGWGKKYGTKAYFFVADKYARFDWPSDKCDLKGGDLAAWKMSWDDASPAAQQATGGAPSNLVPQANGLNGKLWVPSGASGKLGLVVYLHGQIKDGTLGADLMLADDAMLKRDPWAMNLGNLAGKFIAGNKIKPIVVAAPSDLKAHQVGTKLWSTLDFGAFVDEVVKKARGDYKIEIDLDQVAVVGWSGAGCWPKGGLDKVAHEGGKFSGGHKLVVLGMADTWVDGSYSKSVKDGLAGNATTAVYALYKGTGGHQYKKGGDLDYATGLGATRDLKGKPPLPSPVEDADPDGFEFYWDDGDAQTPPRRTVAKVVLGSKSVAGHWADIVAAKGAAKKEHPDHGKMPLLWSWYGLQRYFSR